MLSAPLGVAEYLYSVLGTFASIFVFPEKRSLLSPVPCVRTPDVIRFGDTISYLRRLSVVRDEDSSGFVFVDKGGRIFCQRWPFQQEGAFLPCIFGHYCGFQGTRFHLYWSRTGC